MNKTELIAAVAEQAELSKKDAEKALKAFTDVIAAELVKGEKVQLVGFGTFEVSERAARVGRNPQTKQEIKIPASKAPKFKAGKAFCQCCFVADISHIHLIVKINVSLIEHGLDRFLQIFNSGLLLGGHRNHPMTCLFLQLFHRHHLLQIRLV